jgi:hypothetical protein
MREHDDAKHGGVDRQRIPVPPPELSQPLEEAAIDEDTLVSRFEEVLGPGDGPGRSEKGQLRHRENVSKRRPETGSAAVRHRRESR